MFLNVNDVSTHPLIHPSIRQHRCKNLQTTFGYNVTFHYCFEHLQRKKRTKNYRLQLQIKKFKVKVKDSDVFPFTVQPFTQLSFFVFVNFSQKTFREPPPSLPPRCVLRE